MGNKPTQLPTLLISEIEHLPTARRLIVLIPLMDMDDALLARRIWSIASPRRLRVLYLGLVRNVEEELRVRRRLATLAASTRDDRTPVEARVHFGRRWLQIVQPEWQPGDIVICQAEQLVSHWGNPPRPLGELLARKLKAPICVMSGLYHPRPPKRSQQIAQFIYGTVPMLIVAGFFEFQVQIAQAARGWPQNTLLGLSVLMEFGLIWLWTTIRS